MFKHEKKKNTVEDKSFTPPREHRPTGDGGGQYGGFDEAQQALLDGNTCCCQGHSDQNVYFERGQMACLVTSGAATT